MDNERINQAGVIVITGGSGFIGKHLIAALSKSGGPEVRVLSRNPNITMPEVGSFKVVVGDLADRSSLQTLISPGCTVINLAYGYSSTMAENILCANNLAEVCARSSVKRIIHCSSASVFGKVNSSFIDEGKVCKPRSEYGINKYDIEEVFKKNSISGYQLYTLRPTSVLGVGGSTLNKMINEIRCNGSIKRYIRECIYGSRQLNLLSIDVLIEAIIFFIEADSAESGVYIVSQDYEQENNYAKVSELVYTALGKKRFVPRISMPLQLLQLLLWLRGRQVNDPTRRFSCTKLETAGFRCNENFNTMLKEYVLGYLFLDRRRTDPMP